MAALVEKVNVNAQPTTKKIENEEKMLPRKEEKLLELSPRTARLLLSHPLWWEALSNHNCASPTKTTIPTLCSARETRQNDSRARCARAPKRVANK